MCGAFKQALLDGSLQPSGAPLSTTSVGNYLTGIKALFNFALKNGEDIAISPFANIQNPKGVSVIKSEATTAYTIEQLNAVFAKPGPFVLIEKPAHFLPLFALFTGCRLQEAAQLTRDNFKFEYDRWIIEVTESEDEDDETKGQRVKNDFSIRRIPLHQSILDAGFMDWVQAKAPKTGNIWGLAGNKYGELGGAVSKAWSRECKTKGIPSRFHRLRHTFAFFAMHSNINPEARERLLGHGGLIIANQGYGAGSGYPMQKLIEAVDQLKFEDSGTRAALDLSQIKLNQN